MLKSPAKCGAFFMLKINGYEFYIRILEITCYFCCKALA